MEWAHRQFGRVIGIAYLLPFLYFLSRGHIRNPTLKRNLALIFALGGLQVHTHSHSLIEKRERENINERPAQGAIGWWMVKSGLGMLHHVAYPPPSLFHYSCSILPRNSLERVCIRFLAEVDKDNQDIPRVSPYRLATHLSAALMLYSAMVCPLQHMLNASLKRSEK
jgi:heme A synthase